MEQLKKLFLNEFEVAATRGIGLRALRSMRMRGSGPPFHKISGAIGRKGGRVLYEAALVDDWIRNQPAGGDRVESRV